TNNFKEGSGNTINSIFIPLNVPLKDITSYGFFPGLSLGNVRNGVAKPVDASGQGFFGRFSSAYGTLARESAAAVGVTGPYVTTGDGLTNPASVILSQPAILLTFPGNPIEAQGVTSIFGFTTDDAPKFVPVRVTGGPPPGPIGVETV